jgi:hypothetical protein
MSPRMNADVASSVRWTRLASSSSVMLPCAMAASCDPLCPLTDLTSGMVFFPTKSVHTPRERGSPPLAGGLEFHQLACDPTEGIVKRRLSQTGPLGPTSPPLPSGEPALHNPCGLDHQIRQLLIRQTVQELVNLRSCRPCTEVAQRHRFGRLSLLTHGLGRRSPAGRFGRWRRCPEQVPLSLVADPVSRHAPSSLISLR